MNGSQPELVPFAEEAAGRLSSLIAAEEAEKGMAEMSELFKETGSELYMGAGGREHD